MLMSEERSFTSTWARVTMVVVAFLPALAVLVSYGPNGFQPVVPIAATGGGVMVASALWRRHGRLVLEPDTVTIYNWGMSTSLDSEHVDGFVWRAPQTFLPYGHGLVFVAEERNNGIGLRMVSGIASASLHLPRNREAELMHQIVEWKAGANHYRLPPKWRSRSPLVPPDSGTVDPPPPNPRT